ncbi:MAG: glutamate racemase, partial [Candidatus Sulfotelmatobacter sp.]
VAIVDSAESTAAAVVKKLETLLPTPPAPKEEQSVDRLRFFATDSVEKFRSMGQRFLGHPIEDVKHIDLKE